MSLTISGLAVSLLGFVLQRLELAYAPEELERVVGAAIQLAGVALAWWGRVRRGDVNVVGLRKDAG